MRFNLVPLKGNTNNVGARTTVRFLNFANSKKVCDGGKSQLMAGGMTLGGLRAVMLWHSLSRGKITECVKGRVSSAAEQHIRIGSISSATQRRMRDILQKVKKDLTALRVRSMKPQLADQLTSGAQAVLLALGHCKHVSVYGLSSFNVVSYGASSGYHYQVGNIY